MKPDAEADADAETDAHELHGLTPLGVVIRLMLVVVVAEILINMGIAQALKGMPGSQATDPLWVAVAITALIVIKAPVLYLLVFRPLQDQQIALTQRNLDLQRLVAQLHLDEASRQHQELLDQVQRQRMIQIEKLSALGTMVGGVAHEINNPLMGIMNYVEFARDKATDATSKEVLNNALHEIDRIKTLVANMLVFVRVDGTQQSSCLVKSSVQQTLNLLAGELKKLAIQVDTDVPDDLPPIQCSASSLQQVLVNVLVNARDAVATLTQPRINLSARLERDRVMLSICDNGPGISDDIRAKIFDPFFTTKPVGQGTGLGLAVSRHLMQEAGGSIEATNRPGGGCCFRLTFQLA